MKLQMNAVGFKADQKLTTFIQEKAEKLNTFYDRIQGGEVFLKVEKGEHSRDNKVVEIRLNVPGQALFARESNTSFESAAIEAIESLRRQLHKFKEKINSKHDKNFDTEKDKFISANEETDEVTSEVSFEG